MSANNPQTVGELVAQLRAMPLPTAGARTNGDDLDNDKASVSVGLLARLLKNIGTSVGQEIQRLEQRIAELEATALKDGGTWRSGQSYKRGDQVTYRGVPWNAQRETSSRPGTDNSWRMTTKSAGRDDRRAD